MMKINRCPICNHPKPWIVKCHPLCGIFTRYYIECRICHCCGKTKIGKRRAIKAWNRRAEDGTFHCEIFAERG